MSELVAVTEANDNLRKTIEDGLEHLRLSIESRTPIIIKPNLCCVRTHETGATTDPRIVEALIRYLKGRFKLRHFYIVESDATMLNADIAFQLLGYTRLARKVGAEVVNLSKAPWDLVNFHDNVIQTRIPIPRLFQHPHFLISVAKMKTHDICGVSATLKNLFGCNPKPYKRRYHSHLNQNIVDFASAYRPSLSIIDGIIGMEGLGPIGGTPIRVGVVLSGTDPVAIDHAVARIMGIDPRDVETIEISRRQGVGTTDYNVIGLNLNEVKTPFKRPTTIVGKLYSSRVFRLLKTYSDATSKLVTPHVKQ